MDILNLVLILSGVWVKSDVVGQTLEGLLQLNAEAVEDLLELLLLLIRALTPILAANGFHHRLVDLVDDRVEGRHRVF
jgi:hypothetical protein